MTTEGPWEIRSREYKNELIAHELLWTVLASPDLTESGYVLRIAGHGESALDDTTLKVLMSVEQAEALCKQFTNEAKPYLEGLR
jgi:hypothetical protein